MIILLLLALNLRTKISPQHYLKLNEGENMNRHEFLGQNNVQGFIEWLCRKISTISLNISIASSRFVPNGLVLNTQGVGDIFNNYQWTTRWTDCNGHAVLSSDRMSTKQSLAMLREWLKDAMNNNNQDELYNAALATLEWGGVRGAKQFLLNLKNDNQLVSYLRNMQQAMILESAQLHNLNANFVYRFDSGFTKIHSLLSVDGLPIYDSRVAATIAAFVYLYRQETGGNIDNLLFPVAEARGNQIRNLKCLNGGNVFPNLYANGDASYSNWAKAQVKLGWIMSSMLTQTNLFINEEGIQNRMRALEASLFMIGYDLRCIHDLNLDENEILINQNDNQTSLRLWQQPFVGGRVPTSHNFSNVINWYSEFRNVNPNNTDIADFRNWLVTNHNFTVNTARSYCYPLSDGQMSIGHFLDEQVQELAHNPIGTFSKEFLEQWHDCDVNEDLPNCIADVYIVGYLANQHMIGAEARNRIMTKGYAGTENAANAILTVGRSVGRHFGFLDQNYQPTEFFNRYFSE